MASLYDAHCSVQCERGRTLVTNHLRPFPGQRVLDLGCGTGRLAREIGCAVGKQGSVLGVDPNAARVALAKEQEAKCSESDHRNVAFMTGLVHDAEQHGPFDAVFSNYVLHWVPEEDIDATMVGIAKCLKPGGRLCASLTGHTGHCANDLSLLTTGQTEEAVTGMHFRSLQYWTGKLTEAGLQIDYAAEDNTTAINFPTLLEYFEFVKAYSEGAVDYQNLSPKDLNDFMAKHNLGCLTSKFVWTMSSLCVVGVKP